MNFLIGIIGLGIMVTIHEFGHFLFARLFKVKVLAFSIGWGPKLFKYRSKKSDTLYVISALPLGGYCKMKGEAEFAKALSDKSKKIEATEGSLFGIAPWKRLLISFGGPLFNFISAILIFIIIGAVSSTTYTPGNQVIVPIEQLEDGSYYPSHSAGLKSGDKIVSINGVETPYFIDIQEIIYKNGDNISNLTIERDNNFMNIEVTPLFDKDTGAGQIGVIPWINTELSSVTEGSSAHIAGLQKGDIITKINNVETNNSFELFDQLSKSTSPIEVDYNRSGVIAKTKLIVNNKLGVYNLGIGFKQFKKVKDSYGFLGSIKYGVTEPFNILKEYILGFKMLTKVNLNSAVQGPVRMTGLIGDVISSGFANGFIDGLLSSITLIAIISIILCFTNLLPIPALDGGLILVCIIEMIIRRPIPPKALYIYQMVGYFFILCIIFLVLGNDLFFYIKNLF